MVREFAVERFRFTCAGCGRVWVTDFDVQQVSDGHGHVVDYFFRNGLPAVAPTAPGAQSCPGCGATRVYVRLVARRATPVIDPATADGALGSRPSVFRAAERRKADRLPAEQPEMQVDRDAPAPRAGELVSNVASDSPVGDRAGL